MAFCSMNSYLDVIQKHFLLCYKATIINRRVRRDAQFTILTALEKERHIATE